MKIFLPLFLLSPHVLGTELKGNVRTGVDALAPEHSDRDLFWNACAEAVGDTCGPLTHCCDKLSCNQGIGGDNKCYNSPRLEGQPCGVMDWCDHDLMCEQGNCVGLENIFAIGTQGTCAPGSPAGQLKIMSHNLFMIQCYGGIVPCDENREDRLPTLAEWYQTRDEDVVIFQEVFENWEVIRDFMAEAGFCHYMASERGAGGSGMAIYSKFPLDNYDFIDWFDVFGKSKFPGLNGEAMYDKGVMYARVNKDGEYFHVANTHTQSDSTGDDHDIRMGQYDIIKDIIVRSNIGPDELALMGGDFNEDKYCSSIQSGLDAPLCENQQYYNNMVESLNAGHASIDSEQQHTYDTTQNELLGEEWAEHDCHTMQLHLDFIFYSQSHKIPEDNSSCEILVAKAADGSDLSDHFPITCTYYTQAQATPEPTPEPTPAPEPLAGIGESCLSDDSCASGNCAKLFCSDGSAGSGCTNHDECTSNSCSWGFTCN